MEESAQWIAGVLSVGVGSAAAALRPRGVASWVFLLGMLLLGLEQWLQAWQGAAGESTSESQGAAGWLWVAEALIPGVWLVFSLIYARGNRWEFLARWKWLVLAVWVIPIVLISGFFGPLLEFADGGVAQYTPLGKLYNIVLLLATLCVLINIEKTFRTSVGMARWRIKYLFLGAGLIFGLRIYELSQSLLYSGSHEPLAYFGSGSLIFGCALMGVGHSRSSFDNLDIYPSRAFLQGSLTVVLVGTYFLLVGLLAQVIGFLGGAASLPAKALLILLGLVGLTILLLSDRVRSWLQRFVSRHLKRPEHDFLKLWTDFTRGTSSVLDARELGKSAAGVISENFHVLGVSVLRLSLDGRELSWLYSTATTVTPSSSVTLTEEMEASLREKSAPFDLDRESGVWAKAFLDAFEQNFEHGGNRVILPLRTGDRLVGIVALSDRVNGVPYSHEEFDLLSCIGDQLAAGLLNCSLTEEVLQAKELEAFQTLSTFFVHDLKNAANSLSLMLQNLPVHFDDPEFRGDAVRAIGRTTERINKMIVNLSSLRQEHQIIRKRCRLDELIRGILDELGSEFSGGLLLESDIQQLPELLIDRQAIRSVIVNLIVNAKEASVKAGRVFVEARSEADQVQIVVSDNGVGMDEQFVRKELFRPFSSTKNKGLGIGMFQCKKIMDGHQGGVRVVSEKGVGTQVTLWFPALLAPEDFRVAS